MAGKKAAAAKAGGALASAAAAPESIEATPVTPGKALDVYEDEGRKAAAEEDEAEDDPPLGDAGEGGGGGGNKSKKKKKKKKKKKAQGDSCGEAVEASVAASKESQQQQPQQQQALPSQTVMESVFPWKAAVRPKRGRCAIATVPLKAGDVVVVEHAVAFVARDEYAAVVCHHCCALLAHDAVPDPCPSCGIAVFCKMKLRH